MLCRKTAVHGWDAAVHLPGRVLAGVGQSSPQRFSPPVLQVPSPDSKGPDFNIFYLCRSEGEMAQAVMLNRQTHFKRCFRAELITSADEPGVQTLLSLACEQRFGYGQRDPISRRFFPLVSELQSGTLGST